MKELKVGANPRFMNMRASAEDGNDLKGSKFGKNRTVVKDFDDLNLNPDAKFKNQENINALSPFNSDIGQRTPTLVGEYVFDGRRTTNSVILGNKIPTVSPEEGHDYLSGSY